MQITVTLHQDVAMMLKRRMSKSGLTFKQVADRALRHGLDAMDSKKIGRQKAVAEMPSMESK
jgi:hypothetical protein